MNAYGIAPLSRIQASAQHVSSPPENAIPTRSPTGSESRMTPLTPRLRGGGGTAPRARRRSGRRGPRRRRCSRRRSCPRPPRAPPRRSRRASGAAKPFGVAITSSWPAGFIPLTQRRSAEASWSSRSRSPAPGSAYTSRPSPFRTFTSPSWAMSRETVACTASKPSSRSALRHLGLGRELPLVDQAEDRALPLELRRHREHLAEQVDREVGLLDRDRQRRRDAQRGLAGGADEQAVLERGVGDRAGRMAELEREQQALRRARRRTPPRSARRSRAHGRAGRRRSRRPRRRRRRTRPGCRRRSRHGRPGRSRSACRRRRAAPRSAGRSRAPSRA